jgi:hypothetical protein
MVESVLHHRNIAVKAAHAVGRFIHMDAQSVDVESDAGESITGDMMTKAW